MKIKKGSKVIVISGKNKNKKGTVLSICYKKQKVIIENINMQTRHIKAKQNDEKGKKILKEGPIHYSNIKTDNSKK
uniref:Large ribosomal subunit protein uL24c n=1 Tax=Tolypiocladia glomerulata TaxID=860646 RepID=A0A1Z1MUK0_9FLOR|nr:ribosomal protein L24 [Tolypiocladia glomerulata]ARW69790.1 ribosomal protein L24 [Tolypiocladia glomerulata]